MRSRTLFTALAVASLLGAACGGAPRAASVDLSTIRQPTPDPTLDAVVRDLHRALAGVVQPTATATPTAPPVIVVPRPAAPKPVAPAPVAPAVLAPPAPTTRPTARPTVAPTSLPTARPRP